MKLSMMQKLLLDKGNTKDYYVLESVLKGNYLLKQNWKKDLLQGKENKVNLNFQETDFMDARRGPSVMASAQFTDGGGDDGASKLNKSLEKKPMQEHKDFNNVYSAGINFGPL